jgi:UTP--glucose-1-phosphate uridylyltransferase
VDIIKAIIPAAGLGLRFRPYTQAVAKELLPLMHKPVIQHIIEEIVDSTLSQLIFITNRQKDGIAHYIQTACEASDLRIKADPLESFRKLIANSSFAYVQQPEPLGLGHAVWSARHLIGKEHFAIVLPDDLILHKSPGLSQLIKVARQERANVIAVQEVPAELISHYGVVAIKKQVSPVLFQVSHLVEKPNPKDAPSNLAVIGRYVVSHKLFNALESIEADHNGELQLTDGLTQMLRSNEKIFAYKVQGTRYDLGTPFGWLKATLGYALQDPLYQNQVTALIAEQKILNPIAPIIPKISENIF